MLTFKMHLFKLALSFIKRKKNLINYATPKKIWSLKQLFYARCKSFWVKKRRKKEN